MGQVTLELSELDDLRAKIKEADARTSAIASELEHERARSFDERLAELSRAFKASKEIVDYAVANLSPEFSRGWPADAVADLAGVVATLPGAIGRDSERALIWQQFHRDILHFDRQRAATAEIAWQRLPGETKEPPDLGSEPQVPPVEPREARDLTIYVLVSVLAFLIGLGGAYALFVAYAH